MEPVIRWVTFLGGLMAVGLLVNLAVFAVRRFRGRK